MANRTLLIGLALLVTGGLLACSDFSYYVQSVEGHLEVMSARQPVAKILADPNTEQLLRERLLLTEELLKFADTQLLLDGEGSYRHYVDLKRPFVVWNVVATPPLSLVPETWCFPFAGCVPYRGYFEEQDAQGFARQLIASGLDAEVFGVPAYSTLGWFKDPLLNTFLYGNELELAGLIFHELSHQKIYVKDHSDFNEAFAVVVADKGVERWAAMRNDPALSELQRQVRIRREGFWVLFDATRLRLRSLYASSVPDEQKFVGKAEIFADFKLHYRQLLSGWGVEAQGDWLESDLNNAHFASAATYRKLVPAFESLWLQCGADPERFYHLVDELAQLEKTQRLQRLEGG